MRRNYDSRKYVFLCGGCGGCFDHYGVVDRDTKFIVVRSICPDCLPVSRVRKRAYFPVSDPGVPQ